MTSVAAVSASATAEYVCVAAASCWRVALEVGKLSRAAFSALDSFKARSPNETAPAASVPVVIHPPCAALDPCARGVCRWWRRRKGPEAAR